MDENLDRKEIENEVRSYMIRVYSEALEERVKWRYKINSTILMVSATIFSIIISINLVLPTTKYKPCIESLYKGAVLLNGLCILLLFFCLYGILNFHNNHVRDLSSKIHKPLQHMYRVDQINYVSSEIKMKKIFLHVQKVSYGCFYLMIILYMAFAIFK